MAKKQRQTSRQRAVTRLLQNAESVKKTTAKQPAAAVGSSEVDQILAVLRMEEAVGGRSQGCFGYTANQSTDSAQPVQPKTLDDSTDGTPPLVCYHVEYDPATGEPYFCGPDDNDGKPSDSDVRPEEKEEGWAHELELDTAHRGIGRGRTSNIIEEE